MKSHQLTLSNFSVDRLGRGLYKVSFTCPETDVTYTTCTSNSQLIDNTHGTDADEVEQDNLITLANLCIGEAKHEEGFNDAYTWDN